MTRLSSVIDMLSRELNPERRYVFRDQKLYMVVGKHFPKAINKPIFEAISLEEAKRITHGLRKFGFVVDFEDRYKGLLRWAEEV